MSLSVDGQWITCDGPGCSSHARAPVGLRTDRSDGSNAASGTAGWLFVSRGNTVKHYCSKCRAAYLADTARVEPPMMAAPPVNSTAQAPDTEP